ncbi:MAG: hypothetical protein MK101_04935 [Phycisphaerales bacterium]|nr:hypothetical protein [Phycisphaerales bacterium]
MLMTITLGVSMIGTLPVSARTHTAIDGRIDRVYGSVMATGPSADASAEAFLRHQLHHWNLTEADLEPVGPFPDGRHRADLMYQDASGTFKFTGLYWRQTRSGIPVHNTRLMLLVRNDREHGVVMAAADLRDLGDWQPPPPPATMIETATAAAKALLGEQAMIEGDPSLTIWAADASPRLAVDAVIRVGHAGLDRYDKRRILIDAMDGTILLDEPRILNCGLGTMLAQTAIGDVTGQVVARAGDGWSAQECDLMHTRGMPWARVEGGGESVIADAEGFFTLPTSGDVTVGSGVDGLYFTVNNEGGEDGAVSADATDGSDIELLHNETESELTTAETNAYVHANDCRDFVLHYHPTYPVIDTQTGWPINVNIGDTCNAFYDYSSINFYQSGGSCNNTAFGHVVHHEYGHHLVASGGSGQGEYGEGMSDCIAVIMTGDPRMGPGFYAGNCTSGIRNADNNCQYTSNCSSCGSAIHSCGQLISGCVWSTWQALIGADPFNADDIIRSLTINSILLHTGTSIDEAIAIDFLMLDDDDGDLDNGTPNYDAIAQGFGDHGIDVPPIAWLSISLVGGPPTHCHPTHGTNLQFRVDPGLADPDIDSVSCLAGTDSLSPVEVAHLGGGLFNASLPGGDCGEDVRWFIWAQTLDGANAFLPPHAPIDQMRTICAYTAPIVAFDDDCTSDPGWTIGGDATDGFWERGIPVGGNNRPQTDCDEAASYCWVTENTAGGGGDVDGGSTTLTSPTIDATGVREISYCWWYRNIGGGGNVEDDVWVVNVSDDDGATWTLLQQTGTTGPDVEGNWQTSVFSLESLADFETNDRFRVQFVASDLNETSRVEAAVDNIRMVSIDCDAPPCSGDIDGDGDVGTDDILAILSGWGPDCSDCPADIDGDGDVDVDDLLVVISGFGPC